MGCFYSWYLGWVSVCKTGFSETQNRGGTEGHHTTVALT